MIAWIKNLFSLSQIYRIGLILLGVLTMLLTIFGYGRKTATDSLKRKTAEGERDAAKKAREIEKDVRDTPRDPLLRELRKYDRK